MEPRKLVKAGKENTLVERFGKQGDTRNQDEIIQGYTAR